MKKALAVVFAIGVLDAVLFLANPGFGGGHGRFDQFIGLFGLPWIFVPWPEFLVKYDFVWLVILPFLMNSVVVVILARFLRKRTSSR